MIKIPSQNIYNSQDSVVKNNYIRSVGQKYIEYHPVYENQGKNVSFVSNVGKPTSDIREVYSLSIYLYTRTTAQNSVKYYEIGGVSYITINKISYSPLNIPQGRADRNIMYNINQEDSRFSARYKKRPVYNFYVDYNVSATSEEYKINSISQYGVSPTQLSLVYGEEEEVEIEFPLKKDITVYAPYNQQTVSGEYSYNVKGSISYTQSEDNFVLSGFQPQYKFYEIELITQAVDQGEHEFYTQIWDYERQQPYFHPQETTHIYAYEYTLIDDTFDVCIDVDSSYFSQDVYTIGADREYVVEENDFIQEEKQYFQEIADKYKKGKETATILCSISDYYDDNDNKVISVDDDEIGKMCFDIYDEVIPYKMDYRGQDVPMSRYQNGDPKVFKVLATKIYYDGAVWQELSLQEVSQTE